MLSATASNSASTVSHYGSVYPGTYPVLCIRGRIGRINTTTVVARRIGFQRLSSADTGTSLTPEKFSSRSPAADPTAQTTVTVNGSTSGNPIAWVAVGLLTETHGNWSPPRPGASIQVEVAAGAGLTLTGTGTAGAAMGFHLACDERERDRPGTTRSRGRRPRTSLMHYSNMSTAYRHKATSNVYDVNVPVINWACWRLPRFYYPPDSGQQQVLLLSPAISVSGERLGLGVL